MVSLGQSSEKTTQYFHNGWQVVEERDGDSGAPLAWYVYGSYIDEVLAMVVPGTDPRIADPTAYEWPIEDIYYYHQDDLYNVVALTDDLGAVVERHEYLDYGQMIDPAAGDSAPWQLDDPAATGQLKTFTGREYDPESGYYYFRTRYMDADSGRFITRDSIGIWGDASSLGNGYTFLASSPLNYLDPMGEKVYGVDGTLGDAGDNNATEGFLGKLSGDEESYYSRGPDFVVTGVDSKHLARKVRGQICSDYCSAKQDDPCDEDPEDPFEVNMVGWSRGGAIILSIAKDLKEDGCCCNISNGKCNRSGNKCKDDSDIWLASKPIRINWIGLFDAVKMSPFIQTVQSKPSNVTRISHAVKTSRSAFQLRVFPTINLSGANTEAFDRHDGSPTIHSDIGGPVTGNNDAFNWMVGEGIRAGLKFY